jgi:hypothetical protein
MGDDEPGVSGGAGHARKVVLIGSRSASRHARFATFYAGYRRPLVNG